MRNRVLLFVLAVAPLGAADAQFNGRWDIRVIAQPRDLARWLQVEGAGTPDLKGKFIGFPGGDLNDIQKIWIDNGALHFTFDRTGGKGPAVHQEYNARLKGDKLEGTFTDGKRTLQWIGERAPEIKDKDDGTWREGKPVELFDHKDLNGWHGAIPGRDLGWTAHDGLLSSQGKGINLETDRKFWNFKLHVEYRVGAHSNSGIGLRGRYEVQILEDYGRPLDRHSNATLYSRIIPTENVSKPAGEWQTYDIRLVGRNVTITLNGKTVTKGVIEGLTAIASDWEEAKPGPITLQGDHGPVDFRSIVLTPLVK